MILAYKKGEVEGERMYMPTSVRDYFGFCRKDGSPVDRGYIVVAGQEHASLASANDSGFTFDQIADAIKANWRRL